jgi:phosphoribosylamine--glycine ligase
MKILILDNDKDSLAFTLRCQEKGHQVRVWFPERSEVGKGWITIVPDWKPSMLWADLIVLTGNATLGVQLEPYFKKGFPILGSNKAGAALELDRALGQEAFENAGIETASYETFTDYGKAIGYVKNSSIPHVMKPWGGTADKALSYVPPKGYEKEAMIFHLERCKKDGLKGEFMLQECIRGTEMGVSGWFGPGGFNMWIEEDWEEKKFMNGGLGCNTGEQGTIVRHVKESKLFDMVLKPLEPQLHEIGYVGNINVNCGIDDKGQPWPYELTMRLGWPDFNIILPLMEEPCEWMSDLLFGSDTLRMSSQVGVGVVLTHGEYPHCDMLDKATVGYPVYGWKEDNNFQPCLMQKGPMTAGSYIAVVCGQGETVEEAASAAYKRIDKIKIPSNVMYRTDIGERLEEELPVLQKHGFAAGMIYGGKEE